MAGRKRKHGPRERSGKVQRASAGARAKAVTDIVASQPHRAWLKGKNGDERALDHRAESALGRLFLAGMITEPQCWAGERLRSILREFHVVMASPVTVSAAAIMVASGVENPAEADHLAAERYETDEERRDRVLHQFEGAKRALKWAPDPRATASQLDALVMRDICPDDLAHIRAGLDELAAHWRMMEPPADERRREVKVTASRTGEKAAWPHDEKAVQIVYRARS